MSGLTVIGDIQILHESVKNLKSELTESHLRLELHFGKILDSIQERLDALEAVCYAERALQLPDTSWDNIRVKRDYLLKSTDWTAVSGCTVAPLEWAQYRQYLRDLPQTFAGAKPSEVVWPEQPSTLGPHTIALEEN